MPEQMQTVLVVKPQGFSASRVESLLASNNFQTESAQGVAGATAKSHFDAIVFEPGVDAETKQQIILGTGIDRRRVHDLQVNNDINQIIDAIRREH